MPYQIGWVRVAARGFDGLPDTVQQRIERAVNALATDPRPRGIQAVASGAGALRIRVGDYRVIYEVDDDARIVRILKVAHRREVHR